MHELDEIIDTDAELGDAMEAFDEIEEMELAAQLLEITSDAELDRFIGELVGRASQSIGQFARSDAGRALGGILKQAAKRVVAVLGPSHRRIRRRTCRRQSRRTACDGGGPDVRPRARGFEPGGPGIREQLAASCDSAERGRQAARAARRRRGRARRRASGRCARRDD